MFERFTEAARQVVILGQEEAISQGHDYIGTEHILLGLLREEDGLAARVLEHVGVELESTKSKILDIVPAIDGQPAGPLPLTPHANKTCRYALLEALSLGQNYVGTEHELLGLIQDSGQAPGAPDAPGNIARSKTGDRIDTPEGRLFPDDMTSIAGDVLESLGADLRQVHTGMTEGLLSGEKVSGILQRIRSA